MEKMLLAGETGVGKSDLIRTLSGLDFRSRRAMAVEFCGQFINTPGEFLENPRFYPALITSAADCTILALVQDATRKTSQFPPMFVPMFNRKVIGIVTRIEREGANRKLAERFLRNAGVKDIYFVSCETGVGLDALRELLHEPQD
ncbi:EutP/PduV family microcompartment system protein [Desulfobaculum bizertense]|uniref:Ethanolamine utilization protein EutP n=1 Tax=Desulfobaculum bizertense DSM 18034 TaxID=1121442 RepID=A0A1T4W4E4_9BACT|nr:EutP/PduV family microcompartment system protein [Desulfobaculum bizertense]UIJ38677.1 EutP/PduV family microcompartment system protein [Desulfobaculum bizertense]SKA72140.1 ethanolamine utilization protein EutP [Desulfobaculum bizertense DSM 18034]